MYNIDEIKDRILNYDTDEIAKDYKKTMDSYHKYVTEEISKYPKYLPNSVIDEDKSVKWNNEEIQKRNDVREQKRKELRNLESDIHKVYEKAIVESLATDYRISYDEARLIYDFSYTEHHSYGVSEVINYCYEYLQLYENLRNVRK